jgi:hypothetical protein
MSGLSESSREEESKKEKETMNRSTLSFILSQEKEKRKETGRGNVSTPTYMEEFFYIRFIRLD